MEFEKNFFFLFLVLSQHSLDRNIARMMFFNFLNFLAIFFGIFWPRSGRNGIWDKKFSLFLGLSLNFSLLEVTRILHVRIKAHVILMKSAVPQMPREVGAKRYDRRLKQLKPLL